MKNNQNIQEFENSQKGLSFPNFNQKVTPIQQSQSYSPPTTFKQGIPFSRLLKGKAPLNKEALIRCLSCAICNNIVVHGQECSKCELNFCQPCIKRWQKKGLNKDAFETPCKCFERFNKLQHQKGGLKGLNKLKCEYLGLVRFRCSNRNCSH